MGNSASVARIAPNPNVPNLMTIKWNAIQERGDDTKLGTLGLQIDNKKMTTKSGGGSDDAGAASNGESTNILRPFQQQ